MPLKLILVKILHTLIWAFYVSVIIWIWYSGMANNVNLYTWICIGLVLFEGLVLIIFRWKCPLTVIAEKYTEDRRDNFDIYLPEWLAKHNKIIFTSIFFGGVILVLIRVLI
jgi:hypothetical protein